MKRVYFVVTILLFTSHIWSQIYVGGCESNKQAQNCNTIDNVYIDVNGDILADWSIGGPGGQVQNSSLQVVSVWVQTNATGPWIEQDLTGVSICVEDIKEAGGTANNASGTWVLPGNYNAIDAVYIYYDAWTNPFCDGSCCGWDSGSTPNAVLPVTYSSFTAKNMGHILIEWTTEQEVNNELFIIERSNGEKPFSEIGKIEGSGNNSRTSKYSFIDSSPLNGINYYRIKQYDYDGNYSLTKVISVKHEITFTKSFTFNNTSKEFTISGDLEGEFVIFGIDGRPILHQAITRRNRSIQVDHAITGIYIAKLYTTSATYSEKIFID